MAAPSTAVTTPARASEAEHARLTARITVLSVAMSLLLTGLKLFGWRAGDSTALLASLADSALDVVAAIATFIAVRVAAAPPDAEHRFGHGKAEAFASLLQAALIFASAALIGKEAIERMIWPKPVGSELQAAGIMIVSTVLTVGLVTLQNRVLKATTSVAISGDRAHYASDIASNIAALIGIGATMLFRDPRFDAAAGLFVMAWLVWGAFGVLRDSTDHLMDKELDDAERQRIVECAKADPRVRGVHELRTRAVGARIHIQMHVDLDPDQTLREAHDVVEGMERRLAEAFPSADILIHPDPEGFAEPHGPFGQEGR
jgi:cation diffusion facilitator family transporter